MDIGTQAMAPSSVRACILSTNVRLSLCIRVHRFKLTADIMYLNPVIRVIDLIEIVKYYTTFLLNVDEATDL